MLKNIVLIVILLIIITILKIKVWSDKEYLTIIHRFSKNKFPGSIGLFL
jgi:hypothetical protein